MDGMDELDGVELMDGNDFRMIQELEVFDENRPLVELKSVNN